MSYLKYRDYVHCRVLTPEDPLRYQEAEIRSLPPSLQAEQPQPSQSVFIREVVFWSSSWPFPGLGITGPHLSFAGDSRTVHSMVSQEQRRGKIPLLSLMATLLWCSPGCDLSSGLWAYTVGSCSAFCPWQAPKPPQGCSQSFILIVCTHIWDCTNPGAASCI